VTHIRGAKQRYKEIWVQTQAYMPLETIYGKPVENHWNTGHASGVYKQDYIIIGTTADASVA